MAYWKQFNGWLLCICVATLAACVPSSGTNSTPVPTVAYYNGEAVIEITETEYLPAVIDVQAGTRVIWRQNDRRLHSVTALDGAWNSDLMPEGMTYEQVFDIPGSYTYFDVYSGTPEAHRLEGVVRVWESDPNMSGTLNAADFAPPAVLAYDTSGYSCSVFELGVPVVSVRFNSESNERPLAWSHDGYLFEALELDIWWLANLPNVIDVLSVRGTYYAASGAGLYAYNAQSQSWTLLSSAKVRRVRVLENDEVVGLGYGLLIRQVNGVWTEVPLPATDNQPVHELVTLDGRQMAVHVGDRVLISSDNGENWRESGLPHGIWTVAAYDGGIASSSPDALGLANASEVTSLPVLGQPFYKLMAYQNVLFGLSGGKVYRLDEAAWTEVVLENEIGPYYFTDMSMDSNGRLWISNAWQRYLWYSDDGVNWSSQFITFPQDTAETSES